MVKDFPWLPLFCGVAGALIGWYGESFALRWTPRITYRPTFRARIFTATVTLALFTALAIRFSYAAELPSYLLLAAGTVVLSRVDHKTQLLPNRLLWPLLWLGTGSLVVASAADQSWPNLLRALLGAAALFSLYLFLALIAPASLGMGDVKLAAVLGLYSGYLGWGTLFLTAFLSFLLGALMAGFTATVGRRNRATHFPFGPSMTAAALTSILGSATLVPLIIPALSASGHG